VGISHVKSNVIADFTGTVTVNNSQGSTATVAATDLVRPSDWNSIHNQTVFLAGAQTASASSAAGSDVYLSGMGGVTLQGNGSTVGISVAPQTMVDWQWQPPGAISSSAITLGSASIQNFYIPQAIKFTRVRIPVILTGTSSGATNTAQFNISSAFAIYTNNAGTLSPVVGAQATATWTAASNTSSWSQLTGPRLISFPVQSTLTPGEYYAGLGISTNTASFTGGGNTTSIAFTMSILFNSTYTAIAGFENVGVLTSTNDNQWAQQGVWTAQITNTTRTIALGDVSQSGTAFARAAFPMYFEG
jgi:hypothetical protein